MSFLVHFYQRLNNSQLYGHNYTTFSFSCLFCVKHGGELEIIAERFQEHHTGLEKTISGENWATVCLFLAQFWRTKNVSFLETGFQRLL